METVEPSKMRAQLLDSMDLERERVVDERRMQWSIDDIIRVEEVSDGVGLARGRGPGRGPEGPLLRGHARRRDDAARPCR